ncbi:RHS repeat-associated core domain-containing protein [Paenibacillus sp. BR2-3]|uniref:RHS repeat domain-containing protein n=1 Tax=Paenibacillus sp. BR2-3 TaxID=3048494 RepID=UPI003977460D
MKHNNSLMKKFLLLFLCITILSPNFQTNAAAKAYKDEIIEEFSEQDISNSSLKDNLKDSSIIRPEENVVVANAVYDTESIQRIAKVKALTSLRASQKEKKGSVSSTSNRADLTKKEIENLILSGASKEDIYWVNMLVKETNLAPDKIFNKKKAGNQSWEVLEKQIEDETGGIPSSVEDAVYQEVLKTEFNTEILTVKESVYQEGKLEDLLEINSLEKLMTTFDYTVNSAFDALITQQQINQTNKQQYSDRSGTNELIDPASGSLTWKETEISLPGRDGLDLNVGVMYNSNQSFAYMRDYSSYGQIKKYNYLISRYDLGMGWSFQFPSVQLADGYLFYHDGQGAVYRVDFSAGDALGSYTHLVGYQGKDLQFLQDNGTFNNGQAGSAYYLQYGDKKREYFASDGRLLGIVDRFGNTIKFEHMDRVTYDGQTNKVISMITDSLGRNINFSYESNLNTTDSFYGETITVSVTTSGTETEKVTFKKWRSSLTFNNNPDGYAPSLWSITNQIGENTYFSYDSSVSAKFHYSQKVLDSYAGYNSYHRLTSVSYPFSTSNYQYELVTRNLGPSGLGEEYRIKYRNDLIKSTYNQVNYSYLGDYTGYPTYWDPNNLPESYGFSSKAIFQSSSATNGLATTTYFNGLQQKISTVVEAPNGERKEERNIAFHPTFKYLPTRTFYADFGVGDSDSTANILYSDFSYTDWGAIQSQTLPLTLTQLNDSSIKAKYTTTTTYEPNFYLPDTLSWYQNESTYATESYKYNEYGRILRYTNPKNEETIYTYEPIPGDVRKISKVTEEKPLQNGKVSRTVTTYGSETNYGYPTEQISYFTNVSASGQQSSSSVKKQMAYNMGSGNLQDQTDGNGKKTNYTYDSLGRVLTITYPTVTNLNGEQYDVQDQYTYTKVYASTTYFDITNQGIYYLKVNSKRKYTQKSNGTITYLSNQNEYYDGLGLLRLEEAVDTGAKTQYHVDDLSRAVYVIDPVGNTTTVKYDVWGKQNEAEDIYGNLYISEHNLKLRKVINYTVASSGVAAYRYNMNDATVKSSYIEQNYDQWGQLLSNVTYKDLSIQSESTKVSESYSYDIAGNVLTYTDPNKNLNNEGVTTKYTYDVLNRLNSLKDSMDQITSYQYDRSGQIIDTTMQNSINGTSVSLKSKAYNELGLLYNKKDAASLSENQTYNQLGLLVQKTDRNGTVFNYQYDERNQAVSSLLTGTGGNTQQNKSIFGSSEIKNDTYELYLDGIKAASQTSTIDTLKRVTTLSSQATGYSASTAYVYDKANRTTRLTGTQSGIGSFYINYQYSMQRLDKVQTNGSPTLNTTATVNATYEYFSTGQVKSITYPTLADGSVLKTEYTYDSLNRLGTLQNKKGTEVLSSYTYLYDNNGNITTVTEALNNGAGKTTTYAYDKLNRLYSIVRPDGGGTTTYAYDLQGNRQIVSDTSSIPSEYANTSYTYDLQNTLTGVTKDNSSTSISYLPSGLRYQKTSGTIKTQYNYNGNGEVISEAKSNGQIANYVRGDRLLVKKDVTTAKDYYYLYNGHGDVVQIIDTNGIVVNSYSYDAWGNITNQTEGISNSFKYAGEIYDEDTGLYYLRARYYDPSIGRFLNEDTYEGQITNPLSLNLYTYGHNNPLMFIDPSGNKVVFSQNQYDYLKSLEYKGNAGQKKWARQQLDAGMAFYDTKTKKIVSGSFDSVTEDNSIVYDLIGGIGSVLVKGTAKIIGKKIAKELTEAAVKKTEKKIFWGSWDEYNKVNSNGKTYAKVGDRLYSKHAVDRMQPSGNRYGSQIVQAGGDYGRSVSPTYVEEVLNSVKPVIQQNGNRSYVSGTLNIITNEWGNVVTIITK